ncbi:hypothetical protein KFK09_001947 [Dendrobium nobile]|uniref:Uncharacterized protein n=1 Tax=Dendrobium nobile TaxID=94219 RepID=A0A8T3C8W7_DENNO|nr:hypothetical protein KFK09_001947 [Dendrobium nobile]
MNTRMFTWKIPKKEKTTGPCPVEIIPLVLHKLQEADSSHKSGRSYYNLKQIYKVLQNPVVSRKSGRVPTYSGGGKSSGGGRGGEDSPFPLFSSSSLLLLSLHLSPLCEE